MRINRYIAAGTDLSRRAADAAIRDGRVLVNGQIPGPGDDVTEKDTVTLDGRVVEASAKTITIIFNKPRGYVVSRKGQGADTIYDILPTEYQSLNPVGRLDKDSSGLLVLTSDGALAHELTHPSRQKTKVYEVALDKPLEPLHQQMITDYGVTLDDGPSQFSISRIGPVQSTGAKRSGAGEEQAEASKAMLHLRRVRTACGCPQGDLPSKLCLLARSRGAAGRGESLLSKDKEREAYQVTMSEGRNRQIRRTFAALGYTVTDLHRTHFGPYRLDDLPEGQTRPA